MPPTTRKKNPAMKTVKSQQPPQQQVQDKYAPTAWGSGDGLTELTTPSGQLCLARRPGIEGLIAAGVLNNLDFLTKVVDEKHVARVTGRPQKKAAGMSTAEMQKLLADPKKFEDIMHSVNRIVCHTVVKPEVHMAPNDITNRKSDVIYVDMIDLTDRMFIMNFAVGGSADLERFRREFNESMGTLDDEQGVEDSTE